jgi:hypothetical protein
MSCLTKRFTPPAAFVMSKAAKQVKAHDFDVEAVPGNVLA